MANNDEQTIITPAVAAQRLRVEVYTVTQGCDRYTAYLSPGASPGAGALRRLTQSDIEVLSMVQALSAQGLHPEAINAELERIAFATVNADEQSIGNREAVSSQRTPQGQQAAASVAPDSLSASKRQLEAVERSAYEAQQSQRSALLGLAFFFLVTGFVFLAILLLSWLYGA